VGLLFCYLDFITSGVVRELSARLPFTAAGCTTQGIIVSGKADEIMLALMVLTSDDVEFSTGISEPLDTDEERRILDLYQGAAKGAGASRPAKPSLIFAFPPLIGSLSGNSIVGVLDRASRGTPLFGSFAIDVADTIRSPMTIYKGEAYTSRMPLILFYGPVDPGFLSVPCRG
jgi:hypothetical protein